MQRILVTGGAGFIGSCFIRRLMLQTNTSVLNFDKLTYAGHRESIPDPPPGRYQFVHGAVEDHVAVQAALDSFQPTAVVHFAAESHVDRSIDSPAPFVDTNVVGTVSLLQEVRQYLASKPQNKKATFRFVHISTDEVYGSLGDDGSFDENSPYRPNSPYAASKAASDLFVRSFVETYQFPGLIVHASNNYGPYQLPEKLIPLMILRTMNRQSLPVYGDGQQIRNWIHVEDTCEAIEKVLAKGIVGSTYNIGGEMEITNLQLVKRICDLVDQHLTRSGSQKLISFVPDRPGHDRRYALDSTLAQRELNWKPSRDFEHALNQTVLWYLRPNPWLDIVTRDPFLAERHGQLPDSETNR